jgi:glycosyltransferase 2 family protein
VNGGIRWAALGAMLGGLTLVTLLVAHFGFAEVGHAIAAVGWTGVTAVSCLHLVLEATMGIAWWLLLRSRGQVAPWTFMWGRILRDAGSDVLPLSQIGGFVLGARAVIMRGVGAAVAAASTVVDVTLELGGQILFTALGLAMLLRLRPNSTMTTLLLVGLAAAAAVAALFVVQQQRKVHFLDRLAERFAHGWIVAIADGTDAVQRQIREIYRDGAGIAGCFTLHFATWIASVFEAWIALHLMGAELGFASVLAIESLLYAVRSVAFLIPNALGIQEGAYILLGAAFGLTPEVALALSLVKRARDLVLGVPALLIWQVSEGRRLWARRGIAP